MNITTKVIHGVGWASISQISRLLLQLLIIAILARLLTPTDFGLIAMVVVFTGFVQVFSDFGLTAALIQKSEVSDELLSSCFWLNVVVGLLLSLLLAACAPLIAIFYKEPRLTIMIVVLASTYFISSFGIVQTALFTKKMNFKILAVVDISTVAISGCIAVAMAYKGYGVWSLVWQPVAASSMTVALLWLFHVWKPKIYFKWMEMRQIISYGLHLTGFSAVNYWARNMDNLLIGKYLGPTSLGFYNLAYNMLLFPLGNISNVIGRVMFPALSSIQNDKSLVRDSYIKANRYIAALTFPMMIGLFILAPQFIHLVFGPKWTRSIFLLQILALLGLMQSIGTNVGWIYQSQGRTDIQFKWGIFFTIVYIISFIIGLHWNVEGVTIAYTIACYSLTYLLFTVPFKVIDLKFSYFLNQLKTIFMAAVFMGCCAWIIKYLLLNVLHLGDLLSSILIVFLGVCVYIIALVLIDRELCNEILALAKTVRYYES